MALDLKENPVGIDKEIQKIQQKLYSKLNYTNMDAFGRIYFVDVDNKTIPATLSGDNYSEILINNQNAVFFFIVDDTTENVNTDPKTDVDILFLLDVKKLKRTISHRADEEATIDIIDALKPCRKFKIETIVRGKNALEDIFSNLIDMQPYHFVRIKGNMTYNFSRCML